MRAKEEAIRILDHALGVASADVDEAEVVLSGGSLGVTRFADNGVTQSSEISREVLSVRVKIGTRTARAETSDYSTNGIQSVARQARMLAELLPDQGRDADFADAQSYPDVASYDPDTDRGRPLDRMAIIGPALMRAERERMRASGFVSTAYGPVAADRAPGAYAVANTRGVLAYHAATSAAFGLTVHTGDNRSGWAGGESFSIADLESDEVVNLAVQKAQVTGTSQARPKGAVPLILEPAALATLVAFIGRTAGAADVRAGRSFLSERIDTRVGAKGVTIRDDFEHELHRGVPFDVEGVAKRQVTIIDDGVARGPVYSFANAAAVGLDPTGHASRDHSGREVERADHLVFDGGDADDAELLSGGPALMISRLVRPTLINARDLTISATTADGTYLVDRGDVVSRVQDFRLTISLLDVLAAIEVMTPSVRALGVVTPAVRTTALELC